MPIEDVFALLRLETEVKLYGGAGPPRAATDSSAPREHATEPAQAAGDAASAALASTEISGAYVTAELDHPGSNAETPKRSQDSFQAAAIGTEPDAHPDETGQNTGPAYLGVDDDFMADLDQAPWSHGSRAGVRASAAPARDADSSADAFDFDSPHFGPDQRDAPSASTALVSDHEIRSDAGSEPAGASRAGSAWSSVRQASASLARVAPGFVIGFILLVLLVIGAIRVESPGDPGLTAAAMSTGSDAAPPAALTPVQTDAVQPPAPAQPTAFVAARLLNCRASPVASARALRVLSRGDEVGVLARETGWASIAHEDRQCWVVDRYLSPARPL